MQTIRANRRRRSMLVIGMAVAPLLGSRNTEAANKYYVGATTGFWSATTSWSNTSGGVSGAPVPVTGDIVYIGNTTGLLQTVTYNVSGTGVSLGSLALDATGGSNTGNDVLLVPSGTLTVAGPTTIGYNGNGTINQSGGAVASNTIYLGYNGGSGSYIFSAGTLSATTPDSLSTSEYIGYNGGSSSLTQTGGTNNVSGNLIIGFLQASTGTYIMNNSAARLTVSGNEYVAYLASGVSPVLGGNFYEYAGTHVVNGTFYLGEYPTGTGYYDLAGGTFQGGASSTAFTSGETIGDYGYGDFYQAGGTNTVGNTSAGQLLVVGNYSTGEYDLAIAGAILTVNGSEIIGKYNGGKGTFYQTNGTHSVTGFLDLGDSYGSTGTLQLSGGTLAVGTSSTVPSGAAYANYEIVGAGGTGSLTQTGGTNTIGSPTVYEQLEIGYGLYGTTGIGTYTLSGSTSFLSVYGAEYVGSGVTGNANQSGGTFIQSGGTHNINNGLYVANGSGATGTFILTGGTLNAAAEYVAIGGSYGVFNQTGGTNTIPSTGTLPGLFLGYVPGDYGVYTINGSSAVLTAYDLVVGGTTNASGGTGILNIGAGNVSAALQLLVWNTSNTKVNFTGGNLTVGSLNTSGNAYSFNWTGGTLTIQSAITINPSFALGAQVYLETGMTLAATGAVTNSGEIDFYGGTLNSSGSIINNALITGYGTIISAGTFTNNLQITQGDGNLNFTAGSILNTGTIGLASGHLLAAGTAPISNTGTVNLNGGGITGTSTFTNSISGVVNGPGQLNIGFSNAGIVEPQAGTLNIVQNWTNNGVVELANIAAAITGGTIANNSTIQGFGGIGTGITNNGTIEALNGGTLVIGGTLTNPAAGTLEAPTGNKLLISSGLTTNAGLISLTGGTFDNGGFALVNTGQITGYGTLSTGGLTNAGHFTLSGTSTFATTTVTGNVTNNVGQLITIQNQPAIFTGNIVNNGTIATIGTTVTFAASYSGNSYISDPSTNIFQANVTIASGGNMTGAAGDNFTFLDGTVTNNGTFANSGVLVSGDNFTNTGTFNQSGSQTWYSGTVFTNTAGTAVFGSDAGAGGQNLTVNISGGTVNFAASQHLARLNISTGATAQISGGSSGHRTVVFTPSLSTAGTLDLTTNVLDLQTGGASGLANISSLIKQAYNNGAWTGTGITSTSAATDSRHLTAVGVLLNNNGTGQPIYSTFDGATVALNDVLVKDTYYGDANLDGKVDGSDYTRIDNGYLQHLTGWSNGDFNYDGVVNGSDYTLIDNAFNTQGAQFSSEIANPNVSIAAQIAGNPSAVPEPATLGLLGLGTLGLLSRRRRV